MPKQKAPFVEITWKKASAHTETSANLLMGQPNLNVTPTIRCPTRLELAMLLQGKDIAVMDPDATFYISTSKLKRRGKLSRL
jgi:hypothetical protein